MADVFCPVAYDHDDDLDVCAVCGWTGTPEPAPQAAVDVAARVAVLNRACDCGAAYRRGTD